MYKFGVSGYIKVEKRVALVCTDAVEGSGVLFEHWEGLLESISKLQEDLNQAQNSEPFAFGQREVKRYIRNVGEKWFLFGFVETETLHVFRHYPTAGKRTDRILRATNTGFSIKKSETAAFTDAVTRMLAENCDLEQIRMCDLHQNQEMYFQCSQCNAIPEFGCRSWTSFPRADMM